MNRPTWHQYFMKHAEVAASRSTCIRRHVGAVAVKDKRILAVGYNGAPVGQPHCSELPDGCLREKFHVPSGQRFELCRAVHAEQNLILQAAIHGISLHGADVYCQFTPCSECTKFLITLGIKNFYYLQSYPQTLDFEIPFNLEKIEV